MNQVLAPEKTSIAYSLGDQLQAARLQRGLSLDDIAQRTFIKRPYLQALEEGHYDALPAPVYTSGYIRQVARLLGLDDAPLIQLYHQNRQQQSPESLSEPQSPGFLPVLSQRDGRTRIETIRLMSEPTPGEASQPMESMSVTQQPATAPKQVIETIEGARKEALAMRHQTEQFADQVLLHLEQEIQKTLGIVRNGREYLQKRLSSHQV